jgi:hypothetical protein
MAESLLWSQARGGWKREEKRLKQEFAILEKSARKAGRLPGGGSDAGAAPAAASTAKKRKAEGPAGGAPGGSGAGAAGGGGGAANAEAIKRLKALPGGLPAGGTKKEQKLVDDVAKVMDKVLTKVDRAISVEVCLLDPKHGQGKVGNAYHLQRMQAVLVS